MKRARLKTAGQLWSQLQRIHDRLLKRIDDHAADPAMAQVPGGTTGHVVRTEHRLRQNAVERIVFKDRIDVVTCSRLGKILDRARILDTLIEADAHLA